MIYMKKKTMLATILMLVMTFAIFANSVVGIRLSPRERLVSRELTEITTFDEGVVGWKTFSLPFAATISKDDIRVTHNGIVLTLQEAHNQNILSNYIYVFDTVDNRWAFTTILEPGKAYMIPVSVSDDVTLSAVGTFTDGSEPIILQKGWNYFGLPTTDQVTVSTLKFSCEELDLSDLDIYAAHGTLVNKYFWHLTNGNPFYDFVDLDNDAIVPGDGYCIYSYADNVEMSFVPIFN